MQLNYDRSRQLEGTMIRYKNEQGEWKVGKVVEVTKDGLEISELSSSNSAMVTGMDFLVLDRFLEGQSSCLS